MKSHYNLVIVGAGPNCVYAVERIASLVVNKRIQKYLKIDIFDKNGLWGCGEVHNKFQNGCSILNRIAGQIGFCIDDWYDNSVPKLPPELRVNFLAWAKQRFLETHDLRYDLNSNDWPKRNLLGEALQDTFYHYLDIIADNCDCEIHLHSNEVTNIKQKDAKFSVSYGSSELDQVDEILLLTGNHTKNIVYDENYEKLSKEALKNYIHHVYPLEKNIPTASILKSKSVCIRGTGVTGLDVLIYLTEGSGGKFITEDSSGMKYVKSGFEPMNIYIHGRSGLFSFARPIDEKVISNWKYSNEGRYFNFKNINKLRYIYGVNSNVMPFGEVRQLSFEDSVLPLIILEMNYCYYNCLLGEAANLEIIKIADQCIAEIFTMGAELSSKEKISCIENRFSKYLSKALSTYFENTEEMKTKNFRILKHYVESIVPEMNHDIERHMLCSELKFSFQKLFDPINFELSKNQAMSHTQVLIKIIDYDINEASRGNLKSPLKFACDTVWRDYRDVFTYIVSQAGLMPESHEQFLNKYLSFHNRIADGPSIDVLKKLKILISSNVITLLEPSKYELSFCNNKKYFEFNNERTKVNFDYYIKAYLDNGFTPSKDSSSLYKNLYENGLCSNWINQSKEYKYENGLNLDHNLNLIDKNGNCIDKITVIGPPVEGSRFFNHTLARSDKCQPTIYNLINWSGRFEVNIGG